MSTREKTPLIIHGHFYQPPRENPRTGVIDYQPSASPYANWNERIWSSCYRANAHSRYLDSDRIASISNNYSYLSFNFGATLLSWIESEHPETLKDIIEADRQSVERTGHGNAIAQGFNHTILPLDSPEDARTQIKWGLDLFKSYFGRDSEGFWCPETAINPTVVDILSQEGVKFVILSPFQCDAIEGKKLKNALPPCDEPFILTGDKGHQLAAFFYNAELASGISFGHYLTDADALYHRLVSLKERESLSMIHTATDGEIYGHHEPFGDMALCALIKKCEAGGVFEFTNYGSFLERFPATRHATLRAGEEKKGCSWSCEHGVSRWYKDCGCHTGGPESWNQKWRGPMREAFTFLRAEVKQKAKTVFEKISGCQVSLDTLIIPMGRVASHRMTMQDALEEIRKTYPFDRERDVEVAKLLEALLYSHYSFTSCGWFFNDISGLEPRQNIAYALKALEMIDDDEISNRFLSILSLAKSNIKTVGTGKDIALEEMRKISGEAEAALLFHYLTLFDPKRKPMDYGRFKYEATRGSSTLFENRYTGQNFRAEVKETDKPSRLQIIISDNSRDERHIFVEKKDIPIQIIRKLNSVVARNVWSITETDCRTMTRIFDDYNCLITDSRTRRLLQAETVGPALAMIRKISYSISPCDWKRYDSNISSLIRFASKSERLDEKQRLSAIINKALLRASRTIAMQGYINPIAANLLAERLNEIRSYDIDIDITELQDAVYPLLPDPHLESLGYALNFSEVVVRAEE